MRSILIATAALALAGCTADNPRACGPGDPCRDPAFPFCDLNGAVAGLPGDCLAVTCTAGDFIACDGDNEIRCDSSGANYSTVMCERGCDPASDGCRLCDPDETACTNGTVATCDSSGAVVSSMACPLGCFENEPRCRQVDPSNDLASYLDLASAGPDITATGQVLINTETGVAYSFDAGGPLDIPTFLIPATTGGVPIRVFVVHSISVEDVAIDRNPTQPSPALALVAAGDILISGSFDVGAGWAGAIRGRDRWAWLIHLWPMRRRSRRTRPRAWYPSTQLCLGCRRRR
jgi:hypothetical protein